MLSLGLCAERVLRRPGLFLLRVLKGFRHNQGILLSGAVAYYMLLSIVPLLALLLVGGSVGGTLFLTGAFSSGGDDGAEEAEQADGEPKVAHYFAIEPPITVNFQKRGTARFLQVSLQVMTYDELALVELQKHMPAVRNNLNLLFSGQSYEELSTREGKELLRKQAVAEIQNILTARAGTPGIEDVYFTSFVMQ